MNLECPGCHSRLKLDPAKLPAGAATAVCPKCRARILLPGAASTGTITLKCTHCSARLKVNVARLKPGVSRSRCPKCAKPVSLPAAPPGLAAGVMTRRIEPRDLGLVLGGEGGSDRDRTPANDETLPGPPISVDRSLTESAADLSRLIDEKVEGLGTQTLPTAAEPAPPLHQPPAAASDAPPVAIEVPVPIEGPYEISPASEELASLEAPVRPPEPIPLEALVEERGETPPSGSAEASALPEPIPVDQPPEEPFEEYAEMPLVMPPTAPAEEERRETVEEPSDAPAPSIPAPPSPGASEAGLRAGRGPASDPGPSMSDASRTSPGARRTDRRISSPGLTAPPPPGRGAFLPLLLGGIGGGALLGGVAAVFVRTGWVPAELLPALPEPIASMLGPNLGGVILAAVLTTVGVLLGGTVQPGAGPRGRRSPVSITGCVLGAALLGLLGGIILTLAGSGALPLWPALVGAVELGLAGLLAGGVGRLLSGRP